MEKDDNKESEVNENGRNVKEEKKNKVSQSRKCR